MRTEQNGRHALVGMIRQSIFGRLAGYEDVNDALRLRHDPAMRWIIGAKATTRNRVRRQAVTNLRLESKNVVGFYNKRGTCEQWIKEGKAAIKWTRLSRDRAG